MNYDFVLSCHFYSRLIPKFMLIINILYFRPRHMDKPEMYLWEKVNLVDHAGAIAHRLGSRRKRWFQMYKIHHWGR